MKKIHTKQKPAKRGRPSVGRVRMQVKLTPENRAWLESQAAAMDCSMSDIVNRLIEGER